MTKLTLSWTGPPWKTVMSMKYLYLALCGDPGLAGADIVEPAAATAAEGLHCVRQQVGRREGSVAATDHRQHSKHLKKQRDIRAEQ